MKSFCSCLSLVSALLLVFAATSARESLAFVGVVVVVSPTTMMQKTAVAVRMAADEASEPAVSNPAKKQQVNCPNCDLCDGSGRIAGGIGAVIPWIPIKAFRPCPNFIEKGGIYERSGQGLDEIAFGRDKTFQK